MNRKDRRAANKRGGASSGPATSNNGSLFAQAVRHHQSGHFAEAEQFYRQVLAADRNHFASLHHLGIIALQKGQPQAAIEPLGRAITVDARNPECHYNLAFAFQSLGRLDEAVDHYRRAVQLRPAYADAHTNLGNVLVQLGNNVEAIAAYERVISLKPTAEAHCNVANVLARTGKLDDAVMHFERALALNPNLIAAHNNLANALAALRRSDEAMVHLQRALALNPNFVEAHVNLGTMLSAQGKHAEAAAQFQRALSIDSNSADAQANLGNVLLAQGKVDEAAQCYRRALATRPDSPEANNNLGLVLIAQGNLAEAARCFELAVGRKPEFIDAHNNLARALLAAGGSDNALDVLRRALAIRETSATKALIVQCLRGLREAHAGEELRNLMIRALAEPWGRVNDLAPVAAKLVKQAGAIGACVERVTQAWPRRLPAEELFRHDGVSAIAQDRLLLPLLESAVVADVDLERVLTNARFAMLQIASIASASSTVERDVLDFVCALARQCFINEQVFVLTDEELSLAHRLRDRVIAAIAAGGEVSPLWLAALAGYFPLGSLPGIESILDRRWPEPLAAVFVQQVREPAEERASRGEIPSLTPIEDAVSRLVQKQYEENPYPRWTKAEPATEPLRFDQYLRNKFPAATFRELGKSAVDILIAGCGTGQHAIETAQRFVGAGVLAVDLSLTSLAYALRKTREFHLSNLDYAQADILKLGSIGRSFDVIEASGVLHHMADPFAGWRVLVSLLRPDGLMAVALYSAIARTEIVKAREFIAARGYGASADDIRRARQDLIAHEGGQAFRNVCASSDFFSTSDCRDLLFHVQEHRLSLPQIADFLSANGLDLIGFELDAATARRYRMTFPADRTMTDLSSWDAFEREYPSTFSGMYQFWVQKRP